MTVIPTTFDAAVIELRQYTLHPGQRDTLIELFEREFVEPQEALGMQVLASFRDLDRADRFVWLRGFADMRSRREALTAFYGGPVWQQHRDAANATMIDSDDVLLLRPARTSTGFARRYAARASVGATAQPVGLVTATLCALAAPAGEELIAFFEHEVKPLWIQAGANLGARLVTEPSPNNYPPLPVREGEQVFVWFSCFAGAAAQRAHAEQLAALPDWRDHVRPAWRERLAGDPQTLRLAPTARSAFPA